MLPPSLFLWSTAATTPLWFSGLEGRQIQSLFLGDYMGIITILDVYDRMDRLAMYIVITKRTEAGNGQNIC